MDGTLPDDEDGVLSPLDLLGTVEDTKGALAIPGITSALALAIATATISDDARPPIGGTLRMSLLDINGGNVRFGIPTPIPTMTPVWQGTERRLVPGARVTLFNLSM